MTPAAADRLADRLVPTIPADPAKRALDLVLALVGLVASAPLWLLIAAAIKLEDGGPVLFSQLRVGRGGKLFVSHKFRSREERPGRGGVPSQADLERDRITRVGRVLRATALDELPRLWNILKGEMSFVGPRALGPAEPQAHRGREVRPLSQVPGYATRQAVRPGLTGIAQVCAPRRDLPHRKRFRYDRLYVRRRSVGLDLRLILQSLWISLRGAWPEAGEASRRSD